MEKRNLLRVDFKTVVNIIDKTKTIKSTLKNLNLAGIYVSPSEDMHLDLNTPVEILIYSDRNILKFHLKLARKIYRRDENGIVIKFTKMGPKVFEQLKKIIAFKARTIKENYSYNDFLYHKKNAKQFGKPHKMK